LKCATVSLPIGLLEVVKLYEVLISLSFKSRVSFSSVVLRLTVVCYLKCCILCWSFRHCKKKYFQDLLSQHFFFCQINLNHLFSSDNLFFLSF